MDGESQAQQALLSELEALSSEIQRIKQQDYLQGVRLEYAPGGGTCGTGAKRVCKYARLRCGKGKVLPNGKKSRYVRLSEVGRVQAAIARGQKITQLERKILKLQKQVGA